MLSDKILLATSIIPNTRLHIQISALKTWAENGFDVISFNTPNEIKTLCNKFPKISFIPIIRTGEIYTGKPLPLIADILEELYLSKYKYCGIVNSDIHFSSSSSLDLIIKDHIKNSFIYGARFEVDNLNSLKGKYDPFGFDYFIYDKTIKNVWQNNRFCLGMPFWDHWFPLIPILNGHKVKKIISPIARHAQHPNAWSNDTLAFNDEFVRALIDHQTRSIETQRNQKNTEISENFNALDIQRPYYQIKAKLLEQTNQSLDNPQTYSLTEDLAKLFDSITRDILKFLDNYSEKIKL
ncbi:hypothetical protein OAJ93_00020 [Gammaproteobacteria bacterium]|nr:hypothetical protein [Gammaproteobacteria bacterium]